MGLRICSVYGPLDGFPSNIPEELVSLITYAFENSPLLSSSEAIRDAAASDLNFAKWLRYPSLSAELLTTTGVPPSRTGMARGECST